MNKATEFVFARQEGQIGYYAGVILRVEIQSLTEIQYEESCDPRWELAVRFGIRYSLEQLLKRQRKNSFKIVVEKVLSHEVDTTEIIVAYAAAYAFWNSVETSLQFPVAFDSANEAFLFAR